MRVLLSITSERSDHERLLPTHFHGVLFAGWKNSSQSSHMNEASSSLSAFSSASQMFSSTVSRKALSKKYPEKLEFTNLLQCEKLVKAVLDAVESSSETDNKRPISDQREELSLAIDRLDLTLEIQGERNEVSPLPSIVDVSVLGSDPSPSLKMRAGDNGHFKRSRALSEYQFR